MAEYELFVDLEYKAPVSGMMAALATTSMRPEELEKQANQEIELEIRDPATMETFKVRAVVSPKPEEMPGADTLWLTHTKGRIPQPWAIKIIERIEEEEREVKTLPTRRLSIGERKGRMLIDMLKEREEKMKPKEEPPSH